MHRPLFIAVLVALALAAGGINRASADDIRLEYFPQPSEGTTFTDDYGYVRGRFHRGVDIFGEKGEPVVAVVGGVVERIDRGGTAGNYVVLRHPGGWETWYLHLNNDSPGTDDGRLGPEHAVGGLVEEGWYIPAGAIVGFVGDSGNAEGTLPHTHFEIRVDGKPVDPYPYLVGAWTLEQQLAERSGNIH